jgi:DnaJ-class molecular chaperone
MDPERETCPRCDGEGVIAGPHQGAMSDQTFTPQTPCPVCGGRGTVEAKP